MNRLLLIILTAGVVAGLRLAAEQPPVFPNRRQGPPASAKAKAPLPTGYGPYTFGMERLEVLKLVRDSTNLIARDADFIEGFEQEDWAVLVTEGSRWLDNVFFLFHNKRLYGVVIVFNRRKYSYPLIAKTLTAKYGRPLSLGQDSVIWQNDRMRLQLDRGPRLKYLDIPRFRQFKKTFDPKLLHPKLDRLEILKGL